VSVAMDPEQPKPGKPRSLATARIRRCCVNNSVHRVGANDPELTELHWCDLSNLEGGCADDDVSSLAGKLQNNSHLQVLDFSANMKVTKAGWETLAKPLRASCVTAVSLKKTTIYGQAAAAAAEIRAAVVANAVARLAADDPELTRLPWSNFRDLTRRDFDQVVQALSGNTKLQCLELSGNQQVSDDWMDALLVGLESCRVVTVGLLTTRASADAQLRVRQAVVRNAVDRLASNDPQLTDLSLEGPGDPRDLATIGRSLRSNTHLRSFAGQFRTMPSPENIRLLLSPLRSSGVHSVRLNGTEARQVPNASQDEADPLHLTGLACAANRRVTECLDECRVWQRLLLGALVSFPARPDDDRALINYDCTLMVLEHLERTRLCPHYSRGDSRHVLPIFAWHRGQVALQTFEREGHRRSSNLEVARKCVVS
jgi:hypothetical protein